MLNSLEIRNYRNLKHLRIEKLGRVNLVIGKNNTGKSSLLEAISIWSAVSSEDRRKIIGWISKLISNRDEEYRYNDEDGKWHQDNIKFFSSIFHNNQALFFDEERQIQIGESSEESIRLDLKVLYQEGFILNETHTDRLIPFIKIASSKEEIIDKDYDVEFRVSSKNINQSYRIESTKPGFKYLDVDRAFPFPNTDSQYIKSTEIGRDIDSELWGKIALFPMKEEAVLYCLKIFNMEIEQFTFAHEWGSLKPKIRDARGRIIYLRSMGDGINRILTIILALVNCENGYLLIDEFENGLHYSVQEKLWEIIFQLAEKLNVQVFATTHSSDTIRTFGNVASRSNNLEGANLNGSYKIPQARLIRLVNVDGEIQAISLDEEDLAVINDADLDPR